MKKLKEFYTEEQIAELTGTKQISKQVQWLTDNDYNFVLTYKGRIRLLKSHVLEKLNKLN